MSEDRGVYLRRSDAGWNETPRRSPTTINENVRVTGHQDGAGTATVR